MFRGSGVSVFRGFGVQGFRGSGAQEFRVQGSGVPIRLARHRGYSRC